jgi:hypothetical protein
MDPYKVEISEFRLFKLLKLLKGELRKQPFRDFLRLHQFLVGFQPIPRLPTFAGTWFTSLLTIERK